MKMMKIVSYASKNPERQAELRKGIAEIFGSRPYELQFVGEEAEARSVAQDADIIFAWVLPASVAEAAKKLKWVHIGYAGVDKSLSPILIERDVILTNARGVHGQYIAEWAMGALYYLAHRFHEAEAWRRDRKWKPHKDVMTCQRFLLQSRRALIVGYGSAGKALGDKLRAAGVECEGVVSTMRAADIPLHTAEELPRIIGTFDIVILALPGTAATRGLFDREMLQRMKPCSILVNFSRGWVIDETALINALREGQLSAAALDVFAMEPMPENHPLFDLDNVLLTPHISGNFPDYTRDVQEQFLENLRRYVAGMPLENVVDKVRGY